MTNRSPTHVKCNTPPIPHRKAVLKRRARRDSVEGRRTRYWKGPVFTQVFTSADAALGVTSFVVWSAGARSSLQQGQTEALRHSGRFVVSSFRDLEERNTSGFARGMASRANLASRRWPQFTRGAFSTRHRRATVSRWMQW